jgi:predicted small lipoprotein YifL
MSRSLLLLVLALTVASTLAACGLKGPLYLPPPKPAAAPPAAAPVPDTPVDDKKAPGSK